ncbi:hypothetical protein [Oligoflexus tunisiensis]|uniref:hypothetical protein n=1 Tax=Oligoflexus tunisiensis TaxID=708132 RepID=UPI00114C9B8B|nr:hypothetical protein [Oligoflexus tunisiensis]
MTSYLFEPHFLSNTFTNEESIRFLSPELLFSAIHRSAAYPLVRMQTAKTTRNFLPCRNMLKFLEHLADRNRVEGTIRYLFSQLGEHMIRRGLVCLGLSINLIMAVACGPKAATDSTAQRGNTDALGGNPTGDPGTGNNPATGNKGPVVLPSQQTAKAKSYFENKILPLVKSPPCTDCHNDPRIVVVQQGGLAPQSFDTMFKLLKDGTGPNNNRLFNMMRGVVPHEGGQQCTTETSPFCAELQAWYKEAFGDGLLNLGRISDISAQGTASGYAGISAAPTTVLPVRFYLDGESGKGVKIGEVMANLEANDNNIDGPHGFSFAIPQANIDNKPHTLYVYAVQDGKEVQISGSPFAYAAYKGKGQNAVSYPDFGSCTGCHNGKDYTSYWSNILTPPPDKGGEPDSNFLYNKAAGPHSGGTFTNLQPAIRTWWCQEFPEAQNAKCL